MEYGKFKNIIIARIDKSEEITEQLRKICQKENVKLASVHALGAVGNFEVGVFKTKEKKYYKNTFTGDYEIVSLHGTVSTMDGEYYSHLHMSAGDEEGKVFGGHLNSATVSGTCEMVIEIIDGTVDRTYNEEVGLNLFKFV